jgi:transketolase
MSEFNLEALTLAANTVRGLSMDAVQKANSGHPGMPMGMADAAVVLWTQFLKFNPNDPDWRDRDRFVLSAGHGSMLLYSLLHLSGYPLSLDDLREFRQWGSQTPGHPESHITPGVETTTGPLGQGISNAVGMAIAERWLAAHFNRPGYPIVDHTTYVIASDGDLMEGISHEVASLAGHLGLGKLVVLYDDNNISIDGSTDLSFSENVALRFAAYGWHTLSLNGNDPAAVRAGLQSAKAETERPTLLLCRTTIAYGSPNKANTSGAHGEPLGDEEIRLTKRALGMPEDALFYVPDGVYDTMRAAAQEGAAAQAEWQELWDGYAAAYPELAAQFERGYSLETDVTLDIDALFDLSKAAATRNASGTVLNAVAAQVPNLVGGSADLTPSNKTTIKGETFLKHGDFSGRYIHFGVREHGMGAILNGMARHGGIRPFGGTFLIFSDYMRPTLRLAGLMEAPVIYVFTHDSIGLGEDGPTHQPIEQLMSLRVVPNLTTIRPADARETAAAWLSAIENTHGPTALVFSRQSVPTLAGSSVDGAQRGAYIVAEATGADGSDVTPDVVLIGTGTEVHLAMEARDLLAAEGIAARVVSMPSWELFAGQSEAYRDEVLPPALAARVSIEAGSTIGWERYVGLQGEAVGLNHFGASAPYETLYAEFGITAEAMAAAVRRVLGRA